MRAEYEYIADYKRKLPSIAPPDILERATTQAQMFPADLWMLWMLAQVHPSKNIIEIGSHQGGSMVWLAWANRATSMVCIDPWPEDPIYILADIMSTYAANAALVKQRFSTEVKTIRGLSWDVADQIPDSWADMVFIDGDHSKEATTRDLQLYYPKLRSGGLLAGHDYSPNIPQVRVRSDQFDVVRAVNAWSQEIKTTLLLPSQVFITVKE